MREIITATVSLYAVNDSGIFHIYHCALFFKTPHCYLNMPQTGPCRRPSPEGLQLHMHYMSAARIYKHTAAALVKLFGECDHYRSHQSCAGDDMETPGRADKPL